MKGIFKVAIIGLIILLFIFYTIIPTVLIRKKSIGITKRLLEQKTLSLTFDDGPDPIYTIQLLDLLKKYGVKATFFVVGHKVERHPEIIERMHKEGHTIGIHHYQHVSSWFLTPFALKKQLIKTEKAIRECIKEDVIFYRPPWGHFNVFTLLLSRKYQIIMWSDIFSDWKVHKVKGSLLERLRATNDSGSVLLLHDSGDTFGADIEAPRYMLESLEVYLKESKQRGLTFTSLHEAYQNRHIKRVI
ncbi:polysaccharide deacetylase family protein [Peribacillus glennii]|uniref:Polysaccharide deacetylase family protein n=1 Tax=Peribacillus glennii TaxID=2303991 RepID=A0A372LF06_9BACI|nr:polysaccharide deacetylase family protein [Peribacillus glennii]RFU64895.1 polysaccharide deacetylase family protein [Peribacillus glennii]